VIILPFLFLFVEEEIAKVEHWHDDYFLLWKQNTELQANIEARKSCTQQAAENEMVLEVCMFVFVYVCVCACVCVCVFNFFLIVLMMMMLMKLFVYKRDRKKE